MRGEMPIAVIIAELERDNLLPAIVFRTSRSQCDVDAERAGRNRNMHLPPLRQRAIRQRILEIAASYEMDPEIVTTHPHYNALVLSAVGAHHAGQLLMWRLILEELMASGHLRALVATGTVAAGVDFPARTVVITAHSKRGADGFRPLTAAEFQQMSGRAGRRGKDTVGFCIAAPSPFCDAGALHQIAQQPPEPLVSAYFPGPSTVLNLLRYQHVDGLRYTVERSLASFVDRKNADLAAEAAEAIERELSMSSSGPDSELQDGQAREHQLRERRRLAKKAKRLRRETEELRGRQREMLERSLSGLRGLGYLEGVMLSEKGYWAANLCTSLVLELGEMIDAGIFADATVEQYAAIVASISGDPHRKYLVGKEQTLTKELLASLSAVLRRVAEAGMPGVAEDRIVLPAAAYTVVTWMHAENWQEFRSLLLLCEVAEGDAARLITQTAEQLNQLVRLSETHPAISVRAEDAKRRILRPPLTEAFNLESF